MPNFIYKARNRNGAKVQGLVEASDLNEASEILKDKDLLIISVKEKSFQAWQDKFNGIFNNVKNKDVVFMARQLSVMLEANVPVVKALRILYKQTQNSNLKKIISNIVSDVDGGAKLSQALAKYPKVFDKFFVHMIRAGETTGRLDQSLVYLADQMEKDHAVKGRIKGAMIYPAFILTVLVGMGCLMMIFVVPKFVSIFTASNVELPLPTKMLIAISNFFVNYWWLLIFIVIGIIVGIYYLNRNKIGHYYIDLIKVKTPVIGTINWKTVMVRFSRSLSSLLASGVPVTKSLEIVSDIVNNDIYKKIFLEAASEVEVGKTISSTFIKYKEMPLLVTHMVNVGEETGKIDKVLVKVADFYEAETDTAIKSLISLLEPAILVLIGIAGGGMVVSILMPMYNLTESFS